MARPIPSTAVEIQTGLWLNQTPVTIGGNNYIRYELYSSEDYCFYDSTWADEERIYWQYMSLGFTNDSDIYVSIPISELPEGSEIANNPNKPEIA